jgi:hypothetical protein
MPPAPVPVGRREKPLNCGVQEGGFQHVITVVRNLPLCFLGAADSPHDFYQTGLQSWQSSPRLEAQQPLQVLPEDFFLFVLGQAPQAQHPGYWPIDTHVSRPVGA